LAGQRTFFSSIPAIALATNWISLRSLFEPAN
jgi:hypothetical protein